MDNNYINLTEFTTKEQDIPSSNYCIKEYVALYDSRDLSSNDVVRIINDAISNSTYHFEFPVRSDCIFATKQAFKHVFRSLLNKGGGKTDEPL